MEEPLLFHALVSFRKTAGKGITKTVFSELNLVMCEQVIQRFFPAWRTSVHSLFPPIAQAEIHPPMPVVSPAVLAKQAARVAQREERPFDYVPGRRTGAWGILVCGTVLDFLLSFATSWQS